MVHCHDARVTDPKAAWLWTYHSTGPLTRAQLVERALRAPENHLSASNLTSRTGGRPLVSRAFFAEV